MSGEDEHAPEGPSTGRRNLRRALALGLVVGLAAGLSVSWYAGGTLVEPAPRRVVWDGRGPVPEDLALDSATGSTVAGWYLPAADGAAPRAVAVLLHPKHGDRRAMLGRARLLRAEGYASVLVDLQAHGESPGEQLTLGHLERHDVAATAAFARERHPDLPLVVIGWSLGGAAAVLAEDLGADALVLEAVFASLEQAASDRLADHFGAWARPLTPLLTLQLPLRLGVSASELAPVDHIGAVGCPVLVLGGTLDTDTPPSESRRLHAAAPPGSELVLFDGAAHVNLQRHDPELWRASVLGFLERHLPDR